MGLLHLQQWQGLPHVQLILPFHSYLHLSLHHWFKRLHHNHNPPGLVLLWLAGLRLPLALHLALLQWCLGWLHWGCALVLLCFICRSECSTIVCHVLLLPVLCLTAA